MRCAVLSFLGFISSASSEIALARCMTSLEYKALTSNWIIVNPGGLPLSEKIWPPAGQLVLFHFGSNIRVGNEMDRFRLGYVSICPSPGNGSLSLQYLNGFGQDSKAPSHWLPLTSLHPMSPLYTGKSGPLYQKSQ